jgi:hypothetical protein
MQKEMINTDQFDADLTGMAKASIIFILVTLNIPIEQ